jgi:hypothetical protein
MSNHQFFLLKKNNVVFCFHVIVEFVEMEHQEPSGEIYDKFTWKIANFSQLNNVESFTLSRLSLAVIHGI